MKRTLVAIVFTLSVTGQLSAQERPLWELEEVVVSDIRLKNYAEGHKLNHLSDSTIQHGGTFLTSLLAFHSNIHFKENGYGMVSSPAFRGTNASHTAVVWNGININSPLNGQVDFNTLAPLNYSSVDIRSGGGSVQFGTGAIGGSVHLNNALRFDEHFDHRALIGYGSFDTQKVSYEQGFGNGKWSHSFGVNYLASDNDYAYLKTDRRNQNGEFRNISFNFNAGYVLTDKNVLRLYHQTFTGDRNLSGTLVAPGRSRYEDDRSHTQLEWVNLGQKSVSTLKLAHLYEGFKHFENKDSDTFSEGKVTTLLARYSHDIEFSDAFRLNSYLEYDHYRGEGGSFGSPQRNDVALTALARHKVAADFVYSVGLRKDFSSDFSSPLVFSLDGAYTLSQHYGLQLSASRNFRSPTFNDLYWVPGGNLDLVPENSYQIDLGQVLEFGSMTFNLNGYYIATNDMIRWLPSGSGLWSPSNVDEVRIYGLEGEFTLDYPIQKKQALVVKANYAYTVSEDKATREQLIYVPFHRANASVAYNLSSVRLFYQHLYNGPVSIIGGQLAGYQVANAGITYSSKLGGRIQYEVGLTLNNVFNSYYENVALRPMPNRNIQTQLLLNF
ncbi:TonB-dependent receptor [Pricia sp. S334]|uniref:TonB-dependent receptor n=1 Tax=Pricia mediterranea TaxID=3076079 RepID=A0ABU3LA57_9FLAO|nr:TonB-dependent receptor [Pricia sp. S334]MDT7830278.1 TonB-dependent receptor [Pricia sp. S334]